MLSYLLRWLLCCYLLLASAAAKAQTLPNTSLQLIDKIRLLVHVQGLAASTSANGPIRVMGSQVRIVAVKPGLPLYASRLFLLGDPLLAGQSSMVVFRCNCPGCITGWQELRLKDSALLSDTHLLPGQQCRLEFRLKNQQQLLQATVIERPALIPQLIAVKQHTQGPGIINQQAALLPSDTGTMVLAGKALVLKPGQATDLYFRQQWLNSDSCIRYRLRILKEGRNSNWLSTDTVLHVDALPGNAFFILEYQYAGGGKSAFINIETLPWWYQRKQNQLMLALVFTVSAAVSIWLHCRYCLRKAASQRKRLENNILHLQNQLSPHFILNSLSTIQGLISVGRNERANEFLSEFAAMLSTVMLSAGRTLVPLSEDLDQVERYLRLAQLRFGFCFNVQVDQGLNLDAIQLPPQFLQPTIENAILHGVSALGPMGDIKLQIQKEEHHLRISVTNNGMGTASDHRGRGYGTRYTMEQVKQLNQLYTNRTINYHIDINEGGACVSFFFENWLNPEHESHNYR